MAVTSAPSFLRDAFERAGDVLPIPFHLVATSAATVTLPLWREWLRTVSDVATDFAPIVALAALLFSVWATASGQGARAGVAKALGAAGKFTGWSLILVVATLGIWALVSVFGSKRADASPAIPASQTQPFRRRSADDAGEDGDAEDEDDESEHGDPPWLTEALRDAKSGKWKELKGKRHNPLIVECFALAGHAGIKNDETAWCAAYQCAKLERAGIASPKTLRARDFERWGERVDKPRRGDIVVMWRGSPKSATGHVGTYVGETATHVLVVGGNQRDNVTVAKFAKSRVVCYVRPKSLAKSKTMISAVGAGVGAAGTTAIAADEIANTPAEPSAASRAVDAIETVKGPAEAVGNALPDGSRWKLYVILGCALLGVAAAVLIALERRKHRNTRGI